MNNTRKRIVTYLSLTLLFTMACNGCYILPGAERTAGDVKCVSDGFQFLGGTTTYTCQCPIDPNYTNSIYDITAEDFANPEALRSKACTEYFIAQTSANPPSFTNISPTEPPTEEPLPTEPPAEAAPLKPYLTGAFTACDNVAGYVNFTIAEDAPPYDSATFKLLFNDQVAKCAPASNNPKVLTCNYPPAPYGPPAYIQVLIGEEIVNDFKFEGGSICTTNVPNPNPAPEPTEDPNNSAPPDNGND